MANLMDADDLKKWIMRRLGAPVVKIELTEEHIEDAIIQAKLWFTAKKGVARHMELTIQSGQGVYMLPDEVDTVYDVVFPIPDGGSTLNFVSPLTTFDGIPYGVRSAPSVGGVLSTYIQNTQYLESFRKILDIEPEWRQMGRELMVWPLPVSGGVVLIEYKATAFTIEQLNERDHDLLKRYALAMAKRDLGRIRSRFSETPTASGTVTLDGDRLLEEAATEVEALEEELSASAMPIGWLTG